MPLQLCEVRSPQSANPYFTSIMNSDGCKIPKWVISLADDHIESLRMLFRAAGNKEAQLDAIAIQKEHGTFPDNLGLCLDISVTRSMPTNPTALEAAERCARRECDSLFQKVSQARVTTADSMRETLAMMCKAMYHKGKPSVSDEMVQSWNVWFAEYLNNALLDENARLKKRALRQRRKRRSMLVEPRLGLTRPGPANEIESNSEGKPAGKTLAAPKDLTP